MTLSYDVRELTVLVNGSPDKTLLVRKVEHSMGNGRLDSAEIYYDPKRGDRLENYALADEFTNREIEIVNPRGVVLHWGKVSIARPVLSNNYDLSLISSTEPHHFGEPIVGRWAYVQTANSGVQIARYDRPLIFNPILDGKIVNNRSGITGAGYFYFLDETTSYSQKALTYQKEPIKDPTKIKPWSLADCVRYLCGVANEKETHIKNPDTSQLNSQIEDDGDLVKDVHIPDGIMLPDALDILLTPYGYTWQVVYLGIGSRQIFVQKKGRGAGVTIPFQPYGDELDLDKTFIERLDLQYDAARKIANEITVYGGLGETEATFDLVRAWSDDKDVYSTTNTDHLQLDSEEYQEDKTLHRVWRDFVLNEAGDYIGTRATITKPYDLSTIFNDDDYIVRRRRALPTLTLDDDGAPIGKTHGVRVQWTVTPTSSSEIEWHDLEEMEEGSANQVILLEKEFGIRFAGLTPPWSLMAGGVHARVRVTATIQCDKRLTRTEKTNGSFAQERIPFALVLPQAFNKRKVHETSTYYDQVKAKTLDSAEVDDTAKLRKFVSRLADSMDAAECAGILTLHGLDYTYQLGQVVTSISGRDINMTTAAGKWPVIVGIIYDVPGQTTTLILDSYRDAIDKQLTLSRGPRRIREEAHP